MKRMFLIAFVFGALPAIAFGEAPAITSLSPAGGQRGQTVEVTVQGKLGTPPLTFWSDHPDLTATFPEKPDKTFSVTIPESASPGIALLRITNAEGASALRPFMVGLIPEAKETEPNESPSAAQSLETLPVTVNAALQKNGDVDTYKLSLEAGQTLVAEMSANRNLGSPMDGVLQIVSSEGFVLAQNDDDRGNDPLLAFPVPETGTYYLRTFGFPATPNSSIRFSGGADWVYRLTVTTGGFVDQLQPSAVTVKSETTGYTIGWNVPSSPLTISPQETPGETDYILPETAKAIPLSVVKHPVLTEPSEETVIESFPVTICGEVSKPNEKDTFRIAGKKGVALHLHAEAYSLGSQLDPVIRLLDSEGKQLTEVDDPSRNVFDSQITYTPKVDGPIVVEMRDRFDQGSPRHYYRLTIAPPEIAYSLTVASDEFVVKDDKPLEIPITITRDKGFDQPIEVAITGLPEGLVVAPVTSEPKGDSAKKVTLKIERGEMDTFSGPIQITATSQGDTPVNRSASIAVAGTARTSDHLWLTIPAKKANAE